MPLLCENKAIIVKYLCQLRCLTALDVTSFQLRLHFVFNWQRITGIKLLNLLKKLLVVHSAIRMPSTLQIVSALWKLGICNFRNWYQLLSLAFDKWNQFHFTWRSDLYIGSCIHLKILRRSYCIMARLLLAVKLSLHISFNHLWGHGTLGWGFKGS